MSHALASIFVRLRPVRAEIALVAVITAALLGPAGSASAAPDGTGRVAGTITTAATGQPIADICVDVLTPAGELKGRGFTDPDGAYSAGGQLWPGTYVVRVNGCPNDRDAGFTTEFYDDADGLVGARSVTVAADQTTAGIDEDLVGSADGVRFVAPDGTDTRRPACPGGTKANPWGTIEHGMRCLQPGDTLFVRGGTYAERVLPVIRPGTRSAPIRVAAYEGERVLVRGLIRLEGADHWTLDGIDVTSDGKAYGSGEYLVKFRDGTGWQFVNGEVFDARSYAAVRVETGDPGSSEPADWRIADSCIHTTRATHPPYQDHNIYVNTGLKAGRGIIERNLIFDAPNGQNIKLGNGGPTTRGTTNVTIRHNTLWGAVQNVLAYGGSHDLRLTGNILGGVHRAKPWYPNIRGFSLTGADNVATGNLGNGPPDTNFILNDRESTGGWIDGGGNRFPVNPKFDRTDTCAGFHPRAAAAQDYGRYADTAPQRPGPGPSPGDVNVPEGLPAACPPGEVDEDGFVDVTADNVHEPSVDCAVHRGLATGTGGGRYAPGAAVTRGQMAAFLARTLAAAGVELPDVAGVADRFSDDDGSVFEADINRLAAAGIVGGTGPGRYEPGGTVSRGAMATFLVNAATFALDQPLAAGPDAFTDTAGSVHRANINIAAAAGLARGTGPTTYAPTRDVRRDQMATFLVRTLDHLLG